MTRLFQRDFDAELEAEARAAAHERACRYTQEDYDAACAAAQARGRAEGLAQGRAEGLAEAHAALAARQAEALEALGPQIARMLEDRLAHHAALERQIVSFCLAVAEKVLPDIVAARAPEAAAAQIRRALALAMGSPRLRIRLSAATRDILAPDLAALAADQLSPGRIDIAVDPALAAGEARVIWEDGFMEYGFERVCARILGALRGAAGAGAPTIGKAV
jgi:flagellar assembly protein FliH